MQVALKKKSDRCRLVFKNDPSSRKICTLNYHRKDVELFSLINDERMLIKFREDDGIVYSNYWTLLTTKGEIVRMDPELERILEKKDLDQD